MEMRTLVLLIKIKSMELEVISICKIITDYRRTGSMEKEKIVSKLLLPPKKWPNRSKVPATSTLGSQLRKESKKDKHPRWRSTS
jgi:hypothetical protein